MATDTDQIVIVGPCFTELQSFAPRIPKPGETIQGRGFVTNFGGPGVNQSIAAAKLGGNCLLIARVGDCIWGETFIKTLHNEGVITDYVKITETCLTGVTQILFSEDTKETQSVSVPGANAKLNIKDIQEARNVIKSAAILLVQLQIPEEVAMAALELCNGISILSGYPDKSVNNPDLWKLATIFCVHATEAFGFAGLPVQAVENVSDIEEVAATLVSKGCNSVIITLGVLGAFYMNQTEKFHIPCHIVNCTGSAEATDEFIGALAYLLATEPGIPIQEAIEKSCVASSESLTIDGLDFLMI